MALCRQLCEATCMTSSFAQHQENVRIRLNLAYHGAGFHGWAIQPGLRTVEGELTAALTRICRVEIVLTVAGRTDAGVHARGQVAHFDLPVEIWKQIPGRSGHDPKQALVRKVNAVLSHQVLGPKGYADVVVQSAEVVPADFDARFSALWRRYTYLIADGPQRWDPMRQDVLWVPRKLDLQAMNQAAQPLLGEHDFLAFCKPRPGASTVRTLRELSFQREETAATKNDGIIRANVEADAFCHSQVRTLIGTLLEVGRGARAISWPVERLTSRIRNGEVIVAPAHGLTLAEIVYPEPADYGKQAQLARRYRGADAKRNSDPIRNGFESDCGCE